MKKLLLNIIMIFSLSASTFWYAGNGDSNQIRNIGSCTNNEYGIPNSECAEDLSNI